MKKENKNYYEVLDLPIKATQEQIEKAYNSTLVAYSEDSIAIYSLMSSDDCRDLRNQVEEAYSILGNPEKRKEYDRVRGFNQPIQIVSDDALNKNNDSIKSKLPSFDFNENNQTFNTLEFSNNYRAPTSVQALSSIKKNSEIDVEEARRKFAIDFPIDHTFEEKIQNCTDFSGKFLKEVREYKNVSIEKMSEMSRIMKTYIHFIENEEFSKLPATAYIRGFVFQYAKHLKINPDIVSSSYILRVKKNRGEVALPKAI